MDVVDADVGDQIFKLRILSHVLSISFVFAA